MLIIDEPEIYLYANPQRQLLSILKSLEPDVLMTTHSSEIVAEADASDILAIDKTQRSAKRVSGSKGIQSTLGSLGSVHTVTISAIAQTRRVLYVEGEDFQILRRLARRLGLSERASGVGIAPFPLGGFLPIQQIKSVTWGISESIGAHVVFGGIFDRDFRPDEEVDELLNGLGTVLKLSVILERKEIENYLLAPTTLDNALARLLDDRFRRSGETIGEVRPTLEYLREITAPMKSEVQAQYMAKRQEYLISTGKDRSTINRETIEIFDLKWNNDQSRLQIAPGKKVLRELVSRLQEEYKVTLTSAKIIEQMQEADIPRDLRQTIREIESFRSSPL